MAPDSSAAIRSKIIQNSYRAQPATVIKDIKQDFALFSYCVRELVNRAQTSGEPLTELYPVHLLEVSDPAGLVTLVNQAPQHLQAFGAEYGTREQRSTLTSPLVSAAISEELAAALSLDPDIAFATALMRQLGLTLIAWSYPTVFTRAFCGLTGNETIDMAIHKRLGFSPLMLGLTFAHEWRIAAPIRSAMGDTSVQSTLSPEESALADNLKKICRIGEVLTRAHEPGYYPKARETFAEAEREVERILGEHAMRRLRSRIADQCALLLRSVPEFLKPAAAVAVPGQVRQAAEEALPERFAHPMAAFRSTLDKNAGANTLFAIIKQQLFPASGFLSAAVYLVAPEYGSILPRFTLGNLNLHSLEPVPLSSPQPLALALQTRSPRYEAGRGSTPPSILAGIGTPAIIGVLYVQLKPGVFHSEESALAVFTGLRTALEYALE